MRVEVSPIRAGLEALVLVAAVALGSVACTVSPNAEGTTTSETTASTETVGGTTDQTSTTSEGTGWETDDTNNTSASFYAPSEDIVSVSECDPFQQDCPEGEKCVPAVEEGPGGDANECVPVTGTKTAGEACTHLGFDMPTDDCDADHLCFYVDGSEGDEGVCVPFCTGTADDPVCDEGSACLVSFVDAVCLPECDPLLQDCEDPLVCGWINTWFACVEPTGPSAGPGEACEGLLGCVPDGVCVGSSFVEGCEAPSCCAELCDLAAVDFECANPALVCVPFFEEGMAPEDYANVGLCLAPP